MESSTTKLCAAAGPSSLHRLFLFFARSRAGGVCRGARGGSYVTRHTTTRATLIHDAPPACRLPHPTFPAAGPDRSVESIDRIQRMRVDFDRNAWIQWGGRRRPCLHLVARRRGVVGDHAAACISSFACAGCLVVASSNPRLGMPGRDRSKGAKRHICLHAYR